MRNPQRLLLLALTLLLLPSCQPGAPAEPGPIREIDSRVQLFVDDHLVADSDRVWRSLTGAYNTRPRKVAENPIIKPDRPWEGYLVLQPGSAIYDEEEQIFKLWYNTFGKSRNTDIREFLCYATSKDGIHWEKPELGIVEFPRFQGQQHRPRLGQLEPRGPQGARRPRPQPPVQDGLLAAP